jgi:hypothetical protein
VIRVLAVGAGLGCRMSWRAGRFGFRLAERVKVCREQLDIAGAVASGVWLRDGFGV